uniref:Outer membrane protein beta-barrel domain-containing protein n=1 Tax=Candidatus Berkiella aquae TaxID=295108 RepID=A0A0Q9YNA6_9GAMM
MFNNKLRGSLTAVLALALMAGFSTSCLATFDVMDEDIEGGYYGNGYTRPFRNAIEGTETLSAEDLAFMQSVQYTRITERWYLRALVGHPRVKLNKIVNNSTYPLDAYQVALPNFTDNLYQLGLAGGKIWGNWGAEIELLISKKLKYYANPLFTTIPNAANAEINTYALLFNVQYIIPHWISLYPRRLQIHLDAGLGVGLNTTNTTVYDLNGAPIESASGRQTPVAGMLGIGARYQITPCILFDLTYRFISWGKTKYGPILGYQLKSDELTSTGLFVGLTYQI